ncbi:MAG: FxsA family protein [Solirubrobacteraceae bacterium]
MLAIVILVVWPLVELFVAIKVAEAIGVLLTILLLIAGWPIGMWALRSRGRAAWRRLGQAVAQGRPPARDVLDGALVLLGGVLLLVPGFITDLLGVGLLLPFTRFLARAAILRNFRSRLLARALFFGRPAGGYDVDSTASDLDTRRLPR